MQLRDIVKVIMLLLNRSSATSESAVDQCQGTNGTDTAQCQRLYGGGQFRGLPDCTSGDKLTINSCIRGMAGELLNIIPCDKGVFGTEYPKAFLECISNHSGMVYMVDCNSCTCTCEGFSKCTKKGCLNSLPRPS